MSHSKDTDRPARPIWHYLVALVAVAVVPLSLIAAVLVARQGSVQRLSIEQSMLSTSKALSVAVDLALEGHRAALESIAQSGLIDARDWPRLHALASRVASDRGAVFISLFDGQGNQIFNTARPFGVPLPAPFRGSQQANQDALPAGDTSSIKRVFQTGKASNSDLFISLSTKKMLFTVDIPVVRDSRIAYVLNMGLEPATISRLMQEYNRFEGLMAIVVDRNGFIVGRLVEEAAYVGRKAPAALLEALRAGDTGSGTGTSLEGVPLVYVFARSPNSQWSVSVGTRRSDIEGPVQNIWLAGGALGFIGLALGVLLALILARRLGSSVSDLAKAARQGTPPQISGLRSREIAELEASLEEARLTRLKEQQERQARVLAERESHAKDEFLAMLGHELRNPLAAVSTAAEILHRDPGTMSEMARTAAEVVRRQTRVLSRLLDDLLEVGRFVTGKIAIHPAPIDLAVIVEHAVAAARAAGRLGEHRLTVDCASAWINADAGRMEQVVGNLLTNALKYTPAGRRISISVARVGSDAVLRVCDEGIGIDAAMLERIFELFVQSAQAAQSAKGGLGIGLTLVRRIVELHGGTVVARSQGIEHGSEFEVRLPAIEPARAQEGESRPPGTGGKDILIVEDNDDARRMLAAVLALAGHRVREAADGPGGLEAVRQQPPEIAFVDIGLPGMDGFEVARALRQEFGNRVFLVALTGYGLPADRVRSDFAGFDLHVVKPIDGEKIEQVVDAHDAARRS